MAKRPNRIAALNKDYEKTQAAMKELKEKMRAAKKQACGFVGEAACEVFPELFEFDGDYLDIFKAAKQVLSKHQKEFDTALSGLTEADNAEVVADETGIEDLDVTPLVVSPLDGDDE